MESCKSQEWTIRKNGSMIKQVAFMRGILCKRDFTVGMEVINEKKITYFTGQIHRAGHGLSDHEPSSEGVLSGKHTPGL